MLLNDRDLKREHETRNIPIINPFIDHQIKELNGKKVISYGLGSAGYDFRISRQFSVFKEAYGMNSAGYVSLIPIDPKDFNLKLVHEIEVPEGEPLVLPPLSFALGTTVEHFNIPPNMITICIGKSTYARCGIIVNVTPFEPGWRGHATIEITNSTPAPVLIYPNEGIAQLLFFQTNQVCDVTYESRSGKYQDQDKKVIYAKT